MSSGSTADVSIANELIAPLDNYFTFVGSRHTCSEWHGAKYAPLDTELMPYAVQELMVFIIFIAGVHRSWLTSQTVKMRVG